MWDRGRDGIWRDVLVAAGVAVLVLAGAATAPATRTPLDPRGVLLLLLAAAALVARWRAPRLVLGVATVGLLLYQARGYPGVATVVLLLVALYPTVKAGHRAAAGVAIGAVLVGGFATEVAFDGTGEAPRDVLQRWFLTVGWLVAVSVAAEVSRQRARYLEQVEQRAIEAEHTREETARRRAAEERLRIARELHDSLTHSISIIKVQAGVAVHLARKRDEPVPEALLAIQQASGEATRELRATLEVLRGDTDPPGSGLDRLDALVDGARKAGLPVTVSITGERRTLPTQIDRAAYRIIQEALTNITRHAGPATASVRLGYDEKALTVRVDDDGRGITGADVAPGVGLIGMRERVSAFGGSLHAGPRSGGGFSVQAELPVAVAS